jgi:hypothetical protein
VVVEVLREVDAGDNPDLLSGWAGLAVLHGYASRAGLAPEDTGETNDHLDHALELLGAESINPWLGGVAGVAWAAAHLERQKMVPAVRGRFAQIDRSLEELLSDPAELAFEHLYGCSGLIVYALERYPAAASVRLLRLIVARLARSAVRDSSGHAWFTPPDQLHEDELKVTPGGCYNLGVAHGVPGVIGALGALCLTLGAPQSAVRLLGPAVEWLLAHQLPAGSPGRYGRAWAPGLPPVPTRSGWCYGDPGIARALMLAGEGARRDDWKREALAIARAAIARAPRDGRVEDPFLCHGGSGLGQIFSRFYRATGLVEFARAAKYWMTQSLERRRSGQGGTKPGLLDGSAGAALALLAAIAPVPPDWDRCLLLSARRPR